mgnify:CR=1 FL=1
MRHNIMSNTIKTTTHPADIARKNNWKVGDIIVGEEEGRLPLICEITAIGKQMVLGSLSKNGVIQSDEVRIPLNDIFINWSKKENVF